ncbi:Uncharacterised protein [Bordetella pertussis]|nr:Uncharacterised protein [Bordetella pertussis]
MVRHRTLAAHARHGLTFGDGRRGPHARAGATPGH